MDSSRASRDREPRATRSVLIHYFTQKCIPSPAGEDLIPRATDCGSLRWPFKSRTMICLLHGWLLEGSGSNLWTRSIITALSRKGETVHLVCQENHPDRYDAIAEAY